MWPPHPNPLPTVESSLKAVSNVGERGQILTTADFSDAHTPVTARAYRRPSCAPSPSPMRRVAGTVSARLIRLCQQRGRMTLQIHFPRSFSVTTVSIVSRTESTSIQILGLRICW